MYISNIKLCGSLIGKSHALMFLLEIKHLVRNSDFESQFFSRLELFFLNLTKKIIL